MPDKIEPKSQVSESGNRAEHPELLQELLKEHKLYTCLELDKELPLPSSKSLENCLKLFTSLDVLDEDNKFICDPCTNELKKKHQQVCYMI